MMTLSVDSEAGEFRQIVLPPRGPGASARTATPDGP